MKSKGGDMKKEVSERLVLVFLWDLEFCNYLDFME